MGPLQWLRGGKNLELLREAKTIPLMKRRLAVLWCLLILTTVPDITIRSNAAALRPDPRCGVAAFDSSLDSQRDLASAVLRRLLSSSEGQPEPFAYGQWPPSIRVEESTDLRAFSEIENGRPSIVVTTELMKRVVAMDGDRAAFILGHELAHILLGHPLIDSAKASVAGSVISREQEFTADRKGMELSLAANYSPQGERDVFKALVLVAGDSPIEALSEDHPSISERAEFLDKNQQDLWRSMGTFADGSYLLAAEQYPLAVEAFQTVTSEFPQSYEGWNNLGYAHLMIYADKLRREDIEEMGLGQVIAGGYFRCPRSLAEQLRGKDLEAWNRAIDALKRAEELNASSALIEGNLGLAYAMSPSPEKSQEVSRAPDFFRRALELTQASSNSDKLSQLTFKINLAVAYSRLGKISDSRRLLDSAAAERNSMAPDDPDGRIVDSALLFDTAFADITNPATASSSPDKVQIILGYLNREGHESPWWKIAYSAYAAMANRSGAQPSAEADFIENPKYRRIMSMGIQGYTIRIGERLADAQKLLGDGVSFPEASANLHCIRYPASGIELLGTDRILAIILVDSKAPPIALRRVESGSSDISRKIQVGDNQAEFSTLLATNQNEYPLVEAGLSYRFLPDLGLAMRIDSRGVVQQLVIVGQPGD